MQVASDNRSELVVDAYEVGALPSPRPPAKACGEMTLNYAEHRLVDDLRHSWSSPRYPSNVLEHEDTSKNCSRVDSIIFEGYRLILQSWNVNWQCTRFAASAPIQTKKHR